ncbi:MAG: hypothetical protein KW804_00290 [Candidatus Doudnabacteria bacterium]|nr:hypothetical protein [Candidatus Doudnabacteria bacterium]
MMRIVALVLLFSLLPGVASAQETPVLTTAQVKEVKDWVEAIKKWKEKGYFNDALTEANRRTKEKDRLPAAQPQWLGVYCDDHERLLASEELLLRQACDLRTEMNNITAGGPTLLETAIAQAKRERRQRHWSYMKYAHLDLLATEAQYRHRFGTNVQPARSWGVIGAHLSPFVIGPLSIFGPPGVMLTKTPSKWQIFYTWGVDLKLGEYKMLKFHGTLMKAWTAGGEDSEIALQSGRNLVSLSITKR